MILGRGNMTTPEKAKHEWKFNSISNSSKYCVKCGLLAYRGPRGWGYQRGLKKVKDEGCMEV